MGWGDGGGAAFGCARLGSVGQLRFLGLSWRMLLFGRRGSLGGLGWEMDEGCAFVGDAIRNEWPLEWLLRVYLLHRRGARTTGRS